MPAKFALLAVAVLLAACEPEAPGGGAAVPPADAPPETAADAGSAFQEDFVLIGTEPFWRLDVKDGVLTLTRPDSGPLTIEKPDLTVSGAGALWSGRAGSQAVEARVDRVACGDGMSDRAYPYRAEVTLGDLTLKGCGITARNLAALPPA